MDHEHRPPPFPGTAPDPFPASPPPSLYAITDESSIGMLTLSFHMREVVTRRLRLSQQLAWRSDAEDVSGIAGARYVHTNRSECEAWATGDGWSLYVSAGKGQLTLIVAANRPEDLDALVATCRELWPETATGADEPRVPLTFWSLGPNGPSARTRMIDVPRWDDVAENYPATVAEVLRRDLLDDFAPGVGGQLILWHGPPGTGKTWALRALASEWRTWCDFHYITDPETFFGQRASYMLDVLLHQDDSVALLSSPGLGEVPEEPDPRTVGGRWRCLVLEDTGEMLSADASERTGQGLSRLLNVVDGLIGQGLRVLVLITTNEQLGALHPAVSRPGRAASQVLFQAFPEHEAREWLAARDLDEEWEGSARIADLYAHNAGRASAPERRVGFAS
jgi:hypothetical protein